MWEETGNEMKGRNREKVRERRKRRERERVDVNDEMSELTRDPTLPQPFMILL